MALRACIIRAWPPCDAAPLYSARSRGGRKGAIALRHPDGRIDVEPGGRRGKHAGGLFLAEECEANKQPEHGAAERFRQPRRVIGWPRHECAVWPEAAVGHAEIQVRMPIGAGTMRLHAGDVPAVSSRPPDSMRIEAETVRAATWASPPGRRLLYRQ